jgi:deoxyribodipyrimidine photo-lyase
MDAIHPYPGSVTATESQKAELMQPQIVWFRQDLRLADQPALRAAAQAGPVLPVYVLDDAAPGAWARGAASRWWLHHSLSALATGLEHRGARLLLLRGDAVSLLSGLARQIGAQTVHAIGLGEPWARRQEQALTQSGLLSLHGTVALGPLEQLRSNSGAAFKIFSPLCTMLPPAMPVPRPETLTGHDTPMAGERLEDWSLLPSRPNWAREFHEHWQPGEAGALARLDAFVDKAKDYGRDRNSMAQDATSKLSPHLHFGEISPATLYHATGDGAQDWLRQLGWRDFSLSLLEASPDLPDANWRRSFDAFPWMDDDVAFRQWCAGRTGYPIVDAGMRQLWRSGWMHNRVRMIVASFLVKHLLIDWRQGERWFWDTLVDADLANNAAGWQWTAGSGADAAPYFRIFNPVRQGETFDAEGHYVRRWVPELAGLPDDFIHRPWDAPEAVLHRAGVRLGDTYPRPMIDHGFARERALAAYRQIRSEAA